VLCEYFVVSWWHYWFAGAEGWAVA